MALVPRIFASNSVFTVSKPGIDATSPPDVSYKYLALDSRLPFARPLEIGIIPSFVKNAPISFTQTYGFVPAVDVFLYKIISGSINFAEMFKSIVIKDTNGTTAYERTPYYMLVGNSAFYITDDAVNIQSSVFTGGFGIYYVAWQVP